LQKDNTDIFVEQLAAKTQKTYTHQRFLSKSTAPKDPQQGQFYARFVKNPVMV
jgi:hypothetical protein